MAHIIEALLQKYDLWRHQRAIAHCLALNRRGEVRSDGLTLVSVGHRLEILWRARGIHPWDKHLPEEERTAAFVEQSMLDTEAALFRLFQALPQVHVLDFKVLEPQSDRVIIEGSVSRPNLSDPEATHNLSIRMRLKRLGIREHLAGCT
jgi:hypothetical protein